MFDDMKERRLRCDELVYNTLMEGIVRGLARIFFFTKQ